MKILVLGYGNIGSALAADLARNLPLAEIFIAGRREKTVEEIASSMHRENVFGRRLDVNNYPVLVGTVKEFDLVVGTLPGNVGFQSVKAAIDARVDMVDVSYMPENLLTLNRKAIKAGVIVIPDCGVAPGLSNMLVGHAVSKLDQVEDIHIMVGGLPEKPVPPLGYTITWSMEGLIDEYTRRAKIIKDGKMVEVEALTGLEEVEFPGVGTLESFYTDGLRTLIHTVKEAKNMWEKTLRYPGHVTKIKLLKSLGLFDKHPIEVGETHLIPREMTIKLLEKKLRRSEVRDILALKVEVEGKVNDSKRRYVYHLLDQYDKNQKVTAMARTTAYPASILTQLIAQGIIKEKGIIPPEKLGAKQKLFSKILKELEKRQIKIEKHLCE